MDTANQQFLGQPIPNVSNCKQLNNFPWVVSPRGMQVCIYHSYQQHALLYEYGGFDRHLPTIHKDGGNPHPCLTPLGVSV
jgi:hypothetical protein